jgi:hypothetical protein
MSAAGAKEIPLTEFFQYGPVVLQNPLTREEFIRFSSRFPELRMERDADCRVTIMTPVKKGSGKRYGYTGRVMKKWKK